MGYFDVTNGTLLYILVAIGLLGIALLAVVFLVRAVRQADKLGITRQAVTSVIRSSAVFSIIPSISVVIGLISLSTVLGTPWSWFRLSVIGAVTYELTAAEMVSDAMGFSSAGAMAAAGDYSVFGAVMLVTSVCILAGVVTNIFVAKRVSLSMSRYQKEKGAWGAIFNFSFTAALVAAMIPYMLIRGPVAISALLASIIVSAVLYYMSARFKIQWLSNFVMSAALIAGMATAVVVTNLIG